MPSSIFDVKTFGALGDGITYDDLAFQHALAINPQTPTTLYAGTNGEEAFKSTNGGATWSAINSGLTSLVVQTLVIDPYTLTIVNAGTSSGVFKSSDGGTTWTGTLTNTDVRILVLDPSMSTTLCAGTTTRVATAQSLVPALAHDPPVHAKAQNSQPASYHHEVSPHRVAARTRAIAPAGVLSQLKTENRCHC